MASAKKEETDLFDLLKDLVKNWRIMFPCIFLAGIIGVFVALWIRPIYQVDALLQIESKSNKSVGMMGGLPSLFATSSPAETEIELIKSRHIIGEAVEKMHLQYKATPVNGLDRLLHREGRMELSLYEVPWENIPATEKIVPWIAEAVDSTTFNLYDHNKKVVLSGSVGTTYHFPYAGDTALFCVHHMEAEPGQKFELLKLNRLDAIAAFKNAFNIKEKGKKTGILEFSYKDIYPDRATLILNEIATTYLRQNVEQRNAEAQKTLEFLEKQLPDVKALPQQGRFCRYRCGNSNHLGKAQRLAAKVARSATKETKRNPVVPAGAPDYQDSRRTGKQPEARARQQHGSDQEAPEHAAGSVEADKRSGYEQTHVHDDAQQHPAAETRVRWRSGLRAYHRLCRRNGPAG